MAEPPNLPPPPSGPPPPYAAPPPYVAPPPYAPPTAWSPPPSWGYPAAQPSPLGPTRTEPFAIVSLVAALAAGFLCFVGPTVAIVFGHIARSRIKRSGANGSGMALAGVIIGYVEVALGAIAIVVIIIIAVNASGDATHSARTLAAQIQVVAQRSGASPRNGDVVRRAIREAGLADDAVFVGATHEYAAVATTDDLAFQGWRLEVHNGTWGEACLYVPASTADITRIDNGPCPQF
jgi:Domain of unknown function (DUF4190)